MPAAVCRNGTAPGIKGKDTVRLGPMRTVFSGQDRAEVAGSCTRLLPGSAVGFEAGSEGTVAVHSPLGSQHVSMWQAISFPVLILIGNQYEKLKFVGPQSTSRRPN